MNIKDIKLIMCLYQQSKVKGELDRNDEMFHINHFRLMPIPITSFLVTLVIKKITIDFIS